MNDYRIAVCEDDEPAQKEICRLCDEILTKAEIGHKIAAFSTAEELEADLTARPNAFHLLILDIMMNKGKSGMELAREIRLQAFWRIRLIVWFSVKQTGSREASFFKSLDSSSFISVQFPCLARDSIAIS